MKYIYIYRKGILYYILSILLHNNIMIIYWQLKKVKKVAEGIKTLWHCGLALNLM